jgi:rubrerythrin
MAIRTHQQLREHLAVAMRVELSTIPPYLYAMYSIQDPQAEAARLIMSIVAEEMLHLALAANLLTAIGGEPAFLEPDLQPAYPSLLAHHRPDLPMHLAPASVDLVRSTFMVLERPGAAAAAPEADEYHTLGQFYAAIEAAFEELSTAGPLFASGSDSRQLAGHHVYGPVEFDAEDAGGLVLVTDLASAKEAIEVIVHQGEGLGEHRWADPAHQELTHYAKLARIAHGTAAIGPVLPVRTDPRSADYPDGVRRISDLTNATYRAIFHVLDALYRPDVDRRPLVRTLYTLMAATLGPLARHLTTIPLGDGTVAAPTFELVDLGAEPAGTLARMAAEAAEVEPALAGTIAPLLDGSAIGTLA